MRIGSSRLLGNIVLVRLASVPGVDLLELALLICWIQVHAGFQSSQVLEATLIKTREVVGHVLGLHLALVGGTVLTDGAVSFGELVLVAPLGASLSPWPLLGEGEVLLLVGDVIT